MIAKIGYALLILSFLGYSSCYHTSQLAKEDLDEHVSKMIDVFTEDAKHYQFDEGSYHIHVDTLYGKGIEIGERDSTVFVGPIPVNVIKRVDMRTFDYKTTVGLVATGLGVLAVMALSKAKTRGGIGSTW